MRKKMTTWPVKLLRWAKSMVPGGAETGATIVEYALLLALIAVVAVGALVFLSGQVNNTLNHVGQVINNSLNNNK
jgi:Flp pilus assembly pilin Flp